MAKIEINRVKNGGCFQLLVNGVDLSFEVFRDIELVEVGEDPEWAEIGLRITLGVSQLSIDNEANVRLTDHLPEAAAKVRSFIEGVDQ